MVARETCELLTMDKSTFDDVLLEDAKQKGLTVLHDAALATLKKPLAERVKKDQDLLIQVRTTAPFALNCSPSTTVCPQLLFDLNYCLP